jgi:hypothetical protein
VPGGTGDTIRDKDRAGVKTQIVGLDLNIAGAETLMAGSLPVTGPLTDTQLRATAVPVSGTFFQATQPVSIATNTPDVTDRAARLLGVVTANGQATATSNASRKGLYIFNAGTANLFVKLGATATTTTSFTVMIAPNGFWELPDTPIYTGVVDGIWSATGGNGALVTELT